jgi:hypothetical protein
MPPYTGKTRRLETHEYEQTEYTIIVTEAALRYTMEEIVPRVAAIIGSGAAFVAFLLVLERL